VKLLALIRSAAAAMAGIASSLNCRFVCVGELVSQSRWLRPVPQRHPNQAALLAIL
jgi:hypothetical protein